MAEIVATSRSKKDPDNGLDPEFHWINVNALLLMGIVKCSGSDSENSEVFYRIIQPGMMERVLAIDKNLRKSIFLMVNLATILSLMQKNMIRSKKKRGYDPRVAFDFTEYEKKM